ncbi:unnamed protein product [Adineta steineri]|uniref:Uncharacterized protein n=2 Tax=Adineta steineri TaxID=433720 RepID=A0A815LN54_9BILA|nr:unnamed protein product [Adineta steineri]
MLIIIHFIPNTAIQDENNLINLFNNDGHSIKCARFSLFLIFLIIFSAVIASVWIFIADYIGTNNTNKKLTYVQWFGAGNMLFTILLAIASLLNRFGRKEIE